jgi:hypothetical protein
MENDEKEIVSPEENEEVLEEEVIEEVESQDETPEPEVTESPEAKLARLERQAKQLKKKLGLTEQKSETVVAKEDVNVKREVLRILDERDLSKSGLPDELKGEVKAYAKAKGISYADAIGSDYISYLKNKIEHDNHIDEASVSSKATAKQAKQDFSNLSDDQIMELEGDEFKAYKEWLKNH